MSDSLKKWKASLPPEARELPGEGAEPVAENEEGDEDVDGSGSYGRLRGMRDRAADIEFRFIDADRPDLAEQLSFLQRIKWHKDDGSIELLFVDGLNVRIRGVNLFDLKEQIRRGRVRWIQELGADAIRMKAARDRLATPEEFLWVSAIEVTEPKEKPEAA